MELYHYGIKRRSGRYPYGSGERPYQNLRDKIRATPSFQASNKLLSDKQADRGGVIKKGTKVQRISTESERLTGDPDKRKYVSLTPTDNQWYKDTWEYFVSPGESPEAHTYQIKKDLRVAEGKVILNDLIDRFGDKSLKEYLDLDLSVAEQARISAMANAYKQKGTHANKKYQHDQQIYYALKGFSKKDLKVAYELNKKRDAIVKMTHDILWNMKDASDHMLDVYREKGYDAMVDVEDWFTGYAEYPVILLNPKESAKLVDYKKYEDW